MLFHHKHGQSHSHARLDYSDVLGRDANAKWSFLKTLWVEYAYFHGTSTSHRVYGMVSSVDPWKVYQTSSCIGLEDTFFIWLGFLSILTHSILYYMYLEDLFAIFFSITLNYDIFIVNKAKSLGRISVLMYNLLQLNWRLSCQSFKVMGLNISFDHFLQRFQVPMINVCVLRLWSKKEGTRSGYIPCLPQL